MNTKYKGKNLQLLIGGASVGLATSHTLNINANTTDTTTKDSAGKWQDAEVSTKTWQITSDNLCCHGTDGRDTEYVIDAMLADTECTVIFGLVTPLDAQVPTGGFTVNTTDTDKWAYTGKAYITSAQVTANNGEYATMSITLTGNGALTKVTAQQQAATPGES